MTRKKTNLILLSFIAITIIGFIWLVATNPSETPDRPTVHKNAWGEVSQVKRHVKANLNDPRSYESHGWGQLYVDTNTHNYHIIHEYSALNAFGGRVKIRQQFVLDTTGRIVTVVDK